MHNLNEWTNTTMMLSSLMILIYFVRTHHKNYLPKKLFQQTFFQTPGLFQDFSKKWRNPRIFQDTFQIPVLFRIRDNLWFRTMSNIQKQPSKGATKKMYSKNMQQIYRRTQMPKCYFNKVALQFYWNHTSAWLFSCKLAAYFQNIFSQEHVCYFIEITLRHGFSPVILLHIFRTPFLSNASGRLLLNIDIVLISKNSGWKPWTVFLKKLHHTCLTECWIHL